MLTHEPKTKQVDALANQLKDEFGICQWRHWNWGRICDGFSESRFINDE